MGDQQGRARGAKPSRNQQIWLLSLRVLATTLFLGGTLLYQFHGASEGAAELHLLYSLVGLTYLQALVTAVALLKIPQMGGRWGAGLVHAQFAWDLLFATALIYLTGGIESFFSFLYLLIIVGASFFLTRKETLLVASAAAILFGSLLDLQFYGLLPFPDGTAQPMGDHGAVFYTVFIHVVAFFLTALLCGALSERFRRSERALEEKAIDYAELERLNKTILANIGSGLMIINQGGRVRSFNAAAQKITGLSLGMVYDRPVNDLFPDFRLFDRGFRSVKRGEAAFVDPQGKTRVLGFASLEAMLPGEVPGLLVTFQDLTELKQFEEQLKRADRLAAAGQLAAGMAHEIRNPLASISGSVQLLMEGQDVSAEDRRLMGIVVREADRLASLLTDFLHFARPNPPEPHRVGVAELLHEISDLAFSDPRFQSVTIHRDYDEDLELFVDREQMRQALWNLVINAAEALPDGGKVWLGADAERGHLSVEDSGSGIPRDIRRKIFDPFFSTKAQGTGLGLATVHAIVEAHGGRISIEQGRKGGGARFVVSLPRVPDGIRDRNQGVNSTRNRGDDGG